MNYLKRNVIALPLVNNWYASLFNLCPATSAMLFSRHYHNILKSYINSPQMHEIACQHPETKGGPFIDLRDRKVDKIRELFNKTQVKYRHLYQFSEDIQTLQKLFNQHPKGMGLESLYAEIPESFRGMVELYYDVLNPVHFRLIEYLLYEQLNTVLMPALVLFETFEDCRPFALSTPHIDKEDEIKIELPFSSAVYDALFASREKGLSEDDLKIIQKNFGIQDRQEDLFKSLFIQEKPESKYRPLLEDEPVRVRYFAHACVLIETKNITILFDPVISYKYPSEIQRFTYADLPEKIDYVVLTHSHQDHVFIEHLLQLRYKIGTVVVPNNVAGAIQDPSLKLMLKSIGFKHIIQLSEFEKIEFGDGFIQGLPFLGKHSDLYIASKLAYFVHVGGIRLMMAVDSNNIESELYKKIHHLIGDLDILLIGMECVGAPLTWLYGSLMLTQITREMDQSRRLNGSDFEKSKKLVEIFRCQHVYIYAMGQEPWLNYVMGVYYTPTSPAMIESDKLVEYAQSKGMIAKRLFGSFDLDISQFWK